MLQESLFVCFRRPALPGNPGERIGFNGLFVSRGNRLGRKFPPYNLFPYLAYPYKTYDVTYVYTSGIYHHVRNTSSLLLNPIGFFETFV